MKGTDIALIIFVALISTGISFWVGNMVLGNPDDRTETISYMDVITDSLNEPDNEYFDEDEDEDENNENQNNQNNQNNTGD